MQLLRHVPPAAVEHAVAAAVEGGGRDAATQVGLAWVSHTVQRAPMPRAQAVAAAWAAVDAYAGQREVGELQALSKQARLKAKERPAAAGQGREEWRGLERMEVNVPRVRAGLA